MGAEGTVPIHRTNLYALAASYAKCVVQLVEYAGSYGNVCKLIRAAAALEDYALNYWGCEPLKWEQAILAAIEQALEREGIGE